MLAKIADYLKENGRRSLAIVGAGGTGKSALMARAIQKTQEVLSRSGDRLPLHRRHSRLFRRAQPTG